MTTQRTTTVTMRPAKPEEGRASFSIFRLVRLSKGRKQEKVEVHELSEINAKFKSGDLSYLDAETLVKDLVKRLQLKENGHKTKPVTHQDNIKLLDRYWKDVYTYRKLIDPGTMRYSLMRAIRAIGTVSLYTVSKEDLHKLIYQLPFRPNKVRTIVARLNQLLAYAKRDFKLESPEEEFEEVKYLTESEVEQLAASFADTRLANLIRIAFGTGGRLGELFALNPRKYNTQTAVMVIDCQMRKNGAISKTKTKRMRNVAPLAYCDNALQEWFDVPTAERLEMRKWLFGKIVRKRSKELWPKKLDKHIRFHDLRHSFAIEMRRRGESYDTIADLLGDGVDVCRKYYTGFHLSNESVEALAKRLRG